ncbi:fusarin C cluster-oxidoreductase [Zalerion maritima]|uniref:aldehyde dehydrogenase (NAD(+)) n=1 Tax=Zalerion maritima TaxID=339359 RepID=A0AAD5RW45_9PEZI|nr:fusarin C cluster-oxidoreductase [Zalerion maritima]
MDFDNFFNVVNGEKRASKSTYHGVCASNGKTLWEVPIATPDDVGNAVSAAATVFPCWAAKSYTERNEFLTKFKIPEERIEDDEKVVFVKNEPFGVVAAICPWNFPLFFGIGKLAPAVATGNCVILKPSPYTPYSALKLVELAQQVFPPGVVQVLGGDGNLGPALVRHPDIQKISFTGSTATGKEVMRGCVDTMKRFTLEMAGNNAGIIMPDVDVPVVAEQVAEGLWFNAGQVCANNRRLYIHESIYDGFVEDLAAKTKEMDGQVADRIGAIQNTMQLEKLKEAISECQKAGHKLLGNDSSTKSPQGSFFHPVIIDNPPEDSSIVTDEHFGPIVPCLKFCSVDDAIAKVNSTTTGLAANLWTKNVTAAEGIISKLDVGNVYVNGPPKPDPAVPFGGHKQSGMGVEFGLDGLLAYCQKKSVYLYK